MRITPITVTLDIEQPEEKEAARWADAPEPRTGAGPLPLGRSFQVESAWWARLGRPPRPRKP